MIDLTELKAALKYVEDGSFIPQYISLSPSQFRSIIEEIEWLKETIDKDPNAVKLDNDLLYAKVSKLRTELAKASEALRYYAHLHYSSTLVYDAREALRSIEESGVLGG